MNSQNLVESNQGYAVSGTLQRREARGQQQKCPIVNAEKGAVRFWS